MLVNEKVTYLTVSSDEITMQGLLFSFIFLMELVYKGP